MLCKSYRYCGCEKSIEENPGHEQSQDKTEIMSAVSSKRMEMRIPKILKVTPQCNVVRVLGVKT